MIKIPYPKYQVVQANYFLKSLAANFSMAIRNDDFALKASRQKADPNRQSLVLKFRLAKDAYGGFPLLLS